MSWVGEKSIGRQVIATRPSGEPYLVASRCPSCGDVRYPQRVLCPNDLNKCEPYELSGQGTIYAVVQLHLPPQGFEPPLWVGFIDMDGGARVFAQVWGENGGSEPQAGQRVVLSIDVVSRNDGEVLGPVFRRLDEHAEK